MNSREDPLGTEGKAKKMKKEQLKITSKDLNLILVLTHNLLSSYELQRNAFFSERHAKILYCANRLMTKVAFLKLKEKYGAKGRKNKDEDSDNKGKVGR